MQALAELVAGVRFAVLYLTDNYVDYFAVR